MTDPVRDHDEAGEYQSLSPLAAIALILGLLSPAALVTPLLMLVPAAAAGAALLALAKIRASGGALTGARVARWGLMLGVICGVATLVRGPVRDALIHRQTAAVAQDWLTALARGRIDDSFRLVGGRGIQTVGPPAGAPDAPPPKVEELMAVARANMASAPITKFAGTLKLPLTVTAIPEGLGAPVEDGTRIFVNEEYAIAGAGESEPRRVQLQFARSPAYENEGRPWRVESWALVGDSAAAEGPEHGHAHE